MARRERLISKMRTHPGEIRFPEMKTTHEYRGYVFTVTYEPKDPAYVVDFPDIPDLITSGDTLSEAFANACEGLDLHLESLQKLGKRFPTARHRVVVAPVRR